MVTVTDGRAYHRLAVTSPVPSVIVPSVPVAGCDNPFRYVHSRRLCSAGLPIQNGAYGCRLALQLSPSLSPPADVIPGEAIRKGSLPAGRLAVVASGWNDWTSQRRSQSSGLHACVALMNWLYRLQDAT